MKPADPDLTLTTKRARRWAFLGEMKRMHLMQQWFTLSDPAMEEALHGLQLFQESAGLD